MNPPPASPQPAERAPRPTVALAVLATGNHYVFDIAAGLLVTVAGFAAARLAERLSRARPRTTRLRDPAPVASG
jgi:hypothetical protein